jgi:hypothetical protein
MNLGLGMGKRRRGLGAAYPEQPQGASPTREA